MGRVLRRRTSKQKEASGELKATARDQIGLSHMLRSLSPGSGSPCKNAGQQTHVQTPRAHWDAKLQCHSGMLPASGRRRRPSSHRAGRGIEGRGL